MRIFICLFRLIRSKRVEKSHLDYSALVNKFGKIDPWDYQKIYSTEYSSAAFEIKDVIDRFDMEAPADFRKKSLYLSDVLCLVHEGREELFYCERSGWLHLPSEISFRETGLDINSVDIYLPDFPDIRWTAIEKVFIDGVAYFTLKRSDYELVGANCGGIPETVITDSALQRVVYDTELEKAQGEELRRKESEKIKQHSERAL